MKSRALCLACLLLGASSTSWRFARFAVAGGERLEVLGAGFSRTGSKSLQTALQQLNHQVYDLYSIIRWDHASAWIQTAKELRNGNYTPLDEMLSTIEELGYTATMDFPMNLFAPAIAKRRPTAKVIMSVRPLEEWLTSWAISSDILSPFLVRPWKWLVDVSFSQQILKALWDCDLPYPSYPAHISRPLPWFEIVTALPAFTASHREEWMALHGRIQAQLEKTLPASRLLIFKVASGWQPLLEFLGVNDSLLGGSDFPHGNQISNLRLARTLLDLIAATLPLWLLSGIWLLPKVAVMLCCCCIRWTPRFNVARWIWRWKHPKSKMR